MDHLYTIEVINNVPSGWDSLVADCRWGSFYHSGKNLELIQAQTQAQIVCVEAKDPDGRLCGGLALVAMPGPMGVVVNALPYFGSYGDALCLPSTTPAMEQALYKAALTYCGSLDALCLTVITSPFGNNAHHERVREFLQPTYTDERCCQIRHLPPRDNSLHEDYAEKVLAGMEGRARTAYRKVVKSGLVLGRVESEEEAVEFSEIHRENIGGKGGVFKTEAFFRLVFDMSRRDPEHVEMAVVRDGTRLAGGVVLFYFKDMVEYHTTCLREEYRSIGPLNRIIVDRMVEAGMKGYRYWNFGGTWRSQSGVYQFKKSFGAQDHPYFYYTRFFRDLDKVRCLTPPDILRDYPLSFVIPFKELEVAV